MSKEQDLQIIENWLVNPSSQVSENLASKSHETRRIPDPYIFMITEGKIRTAEGINVEDCVEKDGKIYESEYGALLKIQDWANNSDDGMSFWFSPPYPGGYSSLKIVASEILYSLSGKKVLFNRAFVLDIGVSKCFEIANKISGKNYTDSEDLRNNPIFLSSENGWLEILSSYTSQTELVKTSEDVIQKQKTLNEISSFYSSSRYQNLSYAELWNLAEKEARERGLIGDKEDSCSTGNTGSFKTFFNNSKIESGAESFPCPRCHGPIPSGLGITICPYCGLTKEEAGSTCG